jgi:hypothetical protein
MECSLTISGGATQAHAEASLLPRFQLLLILIRFLAVRIAKGNYIMELKPRMFMQVLIMIQLLDHYRKRARQRRLSLALREATAIHAEVVALSLYFRTALSESQYHFGSLRAPRTVSKFSLNSVYLELEGTISDNTRDLVFPQTS